MTVRELLEAELKKRGVSFSIHLESGRHSIKIEDQSLLVSLDNLEREFSRDGDTSRIERFVSSVLWRNTSLAIDQLYWSLEPNDTETLADFRAPISGLVDRVLVHYSPDGESITWVTPEMLGVLEISIDQAAEAAFSNLSRDLQKVQIEHQDIDGVKLGFLNTDSPFKASFILAPVLKMLVKNDYGWPLISVAPNRDFLYFWSPRHADFVQRLGSVTVREYNEGAYPLSTEVYAVDDDGVRAIGSFPTGSGDR